MSQRESGSSSADESEPAPDGMDGGMAVAFGALPAAGSSILVALEAQGLPADRIALRSPAEESPGPVLRPRSDDPATRVEGRYQVLGEIARGGVGVVLRGHDMDLGRDVAIKVLREDHGRAPEVLKRFVEEAQVGGQLQHPGIVPVYEIGMRSDRRPFFSMKLVKGRTLAAILAERKTPSDDRRRLLGIFESVCQTVAYAHSRGVVHRDLKPSNVMVGAFGEVLVVDWGLAKVLRSGGVADERRAREAQSPETLVQTVRTKDEGSGSLVGTVMGTPAYMPPEQAMGRVEAVDERSDVFSLGAILCEILTGQPPYVGESEDLLLMAIAADLAGARERLAASDADPRLVALAQECLAPAKSARPREASAVAAAIARYLADLEDRARRAEVEAAEARARAEHERVEAQQARRAKRLGLALATAVSALVVLGAGGWWWMEAGRRSREDQAAQAVDEALAQAGERRGVALGGGPEGLGAWEEAVAAARRAAEIADAAGADDSTRARASAALHGLELERATARRAAEVRAADERLLARLDEGRTPRHDDDDGTAAEAAYAEAFREYGLAVEEGDPEAVARAARARSTAAAIARALDSWSALRRRQRPWDPSQADRLATIARRADPDPTRTSVRVLVSQQDRAGLQRMAREMDVAQLPPETRTLLGDALQGVGDVEAAVAVYRAARQDAPSSYWMNFQLGYLLQDLHPAPYEESVRFLIAASALRPANSEPWHFIGIGLLGKGDTDGAIAAWKEGLRLQPGRTHLLGHIADALGQQGRADEALAMARDAVRRTPGDAYAHQMLGQLLMPTDPAGALAAFREAARVEPARDGVHWRLAQECLRQADVPGAVAAAREEVRLRPLSSTAHATLGAALKAASSLAEAERECREAIRLRPDLPAGHSELGRVLGERGALTEAIAEHRLAVRLAPKDPDRWIHLSNVLAGVDSAGSIDAAKKAIELAPTRDVARGALAAALVGAADFEGAEATLLEAVRLGPKAPEWPALLATVRERRGDGLGAVAAARDAVRLAPERAQYRRELGALLEAQGDLAGATEALVDAVRLGPRDVEARVAYADLLLRRGDEAGFRREFDVALGLGRDRAVARVCLEGMRADRGDRSGADAVLREGLRESPGHPAYLLRRGFLHVDRDWGTVAAVSRQLIASRPGLAWGHLGLIQALRGLGKLDEARAEVESQLVAHPESSTLHANLSHVLHAQGDLDGAISAARRAIDACERGAADPMLELDEETIAGEAGLAKTVRLVPQGHYLTLALLLLERGDADGVVRTMSACIDRHPGSRKLEGAIQFWLGTGKLRRNDPEGALDPLRKAVALAPRDKSAVLGLAVALEAVGEVDRALDAFRAALRLAPGDAALHRSVGQLLLAREEYRGAIEELRTAVRTAPTNLDSRFWLADALQHVGDWSGAREALRSGIDAARAGPDGERLRAELAGVERLAAFAARVDPATVAEADLAGEQERLDVATLCRARTLFAAQVRWLERALASGKGTESPGSLPIFVEGARAAAHAALGEGDDASALPEEERARLRAVARRWLGVSLGRWKESAAKFPPGSKEILQLRRELERARRAPVFSAFTAEERLERLPQDEQPLWRALWADFDAFVQRLRPPPLD